MKRGFTLIELLVVMAIIAILAGLLMPALARARKQAHISACSSNEHNVGQYFKMYESDHGSRAVSWSYVPTGGAGVCYDSSMSIVLLTPSYTDTSKIFVCPATSDHDIKIEIMDNSKQPYTDYFGLPGLKLAGQQTPTLASAADVYRFQTNIPAGLTSITENDSDYLIDPRVPTNSNGSRVVYGDGPDLGFMRDNTAGQFAAGSYANHSYGANLLFYDGHVAFVLMTGRDGRIPNDAPGGAADASNVMLYYDPDVYSDDGDLVGTPASYSATSFQGNMDKDCNLGNFILPAKGTNPDKAIDYPASGFSGPTNGQWNDWATLP